MRHFLPSLILLAVFLVFQVADPIIVELPVPAAPPLAYITSGNSFIDTEWEKVRKVYPHEWHYAHYIKWGYDPRSLGWVYANFEKTTIYLSSYWFMDPDMILPSEYSYGGVLVHELRHIVQQQWGMQWPVESKERDSEAHANYYRLLEKTQ